MLIAASGYRVRAVGHHKTTWNLLPAVAGSEFAPIAEYFDDCRKLRNIIDYERVDVVEERDVKDLLAELTTFRTSVLAWLAREHPELA